MSPQRETRPHAVIRSLSKPWRLCVGFHFPDVEEGGGKYLHKQSFGVTYLGLLSWACLLSGGLGVLGGDLDVPVETWVV